MRTHSSNMTSETSFRRWDFSSMICCDPDELQFCKQINESTWEFVQVTHSKLYGLYSGEPTQLSEAYKNDVTYKGINVTDAIHCKGGITCGIIDLNDYEDEEIEDYICGYGYTLNDNASNGRTSIKKLYSNWQQICCECIFEQDNQTIILANLNGLIEKEQI